MGCETHGGHAHKHGAGCGHHAISHEGHTDYIHDGHLHNVHDGHVDEHHLASGRDNPAACTPTHQCGAHEAAHVHGPTCGHEQLPHGDHVNFIVGGHLHHPHGKHCDDHGAVQTA
jgi:hypothetical protein